MQAKENAKGEFVATLIHESDYAKQVGQVATVDQPTQVRSAQRTCDGAVSLEIIPMVRVQAITHKISYALAPELVGAFCIAVLVAVMLLPISPGTGIPIGALLLAAGGGFFWLRGAKRHVIEFSLGQKTILWRSRAGEFKDRDAVVQKAVAFAKGDGLLSKYPPAVPNPLRRSA